MTLDFTLTKFRTLCTAVAQHYPHPDAGGVFPGREATFALCDDAPRHRQEAHERAPHSEGGAGVGDKGDVLLQDEWHCFPC